MASNREMNRVVRFSLLLLVLCSAGFSVKAQTVGTSCPTVGWMTVQPNQIIYCSTSNLWALGEEITSTGNVGIGTTSPGEALTVAGITSYNQVKFTGSTSSGTGIAIENTASGGHKWDLISSPPGLPGWFGIFDESASTYRIGIDTFGHTSITGNGSGFSPLSSLDVGGTGGVAIGASYAGFSAAPSNGMIVQGSVGIGTTTPAYTLDVQQSTSANNAVISVTNNSSSSSQGAYLETNDPNSLYSEVILGAESYSWRLGMLGTNSLYFSDGYGKTPVVIEQNGVNQTLHIAATGNVGLGSTSPVASLDLSQKSDAIALPAGTISQRPSSPVNGMLRYNATSTATLEAYINGAWQALITGTGGGLTLTLGTAATATNPQRSGDATTGLFSATAGSISNASAGVDVGDFSASGLNLPGAATSYKLNGNNAVWQDTTNLNLSLGSSALATSDTPSGTPCTGLGQCNVGVGYQALNANTVGHSNTAFGASVLSLNTSGSNNTGIGTSVLTLNTTGSFNLGLGNVALTKNTAGTYNTAIGNGALGINTTGSYNMALGASALSANHTGSNNIAIGYSVASTTLNGGSYNILIGTSSALDTLASATSYNLNLGNLLQGDMTYSTALGREALYIQSTASSVDYLQIAGGATGTPGTVTISGQGTDTSVNIELQPKGTGRVGIGTASPVATLDVNGFARLALNSAAPATCSSTIPGALALNHLAQICVCNGTAWNFDSTGAACTW